MTMFSKSLFPHILSLLTDLDTRLSKLCMLYPTHFYNLHRVEIEVLRSELEQERARAAQLEAQLKQLAMESGQNFEIPVKEHSKVSPRSVRQELNSEGPIVKSAFSSDIPSATDRPSSSTRHSTTTTTTAHHTTSERLSITDMVAECMHNPLSMAIIRSNLKADNLTPRIQRKFRYKPTSAALPAIPSPLTHNGAQATEKNSLPKDNDKDNNHYCLNLAGIRIENNIGQHSYTHTARMVMCKRFTP